MSRAVSYGDLLTSKDKISNNVHMTTKFCHQLIVIMYFLTQVCLWKQHKRLILTIMCT